MNANLGFPAVGSHAWTNSDLSTMNEPEHAHDLDQQIRINELREQTREAAGGEMTTWESEDCPPNIAEQFWSNVLAYESAAQTCHFLQLEERGIELPAPEDLSDDEQLTAKLWEVIHALASMNVFLSQTDHWSDRKLYDAIWHDTLREITMDLPPDSGWTHHIDFLSSGSDEDNELYLKYYADEEWGAVAQGLPERRDPAPRRPTLRSRPPPPQSRRRMMPRPARPRHPLRRALFTI